MIDGTLLRCPSLTLPSKHRALGPKEKQTPCEGAPFSLPGPWTWTTVVITLSDLDVLPVFVTTICAFCLMATGVVFLVFRTPGFGAERESRLVVPEGPKAPGLLRGVGLSSLLRTSGWRSTKSRRRQKLAKPVERCVSGKGGAQWTGLVGASPCFGLIPFEVFVVKGSPN